MLEHLGDVLTSDSKLVRWLASNPINNENTAAFMWIGNAHGRGCCWPIVPGPDMTSLHLGFGTAPQLK